MGGKLTISISSTDSESPKFLSLEGLRGILALLVCVGHLGLNTMANKIGLTVRFGLAVDVFFALSGFVLCYSNYFGRRTLKRFIVGRFARLYPVYAVTFVVTALMAPAFANGANIRIFVQQVFLLQNIGLWPNVLPQNFPNWSISVEFWISILFFMALRKRTSRLLILLAVVALPAILVPTYISGDAQNTFSVVNFGLLRGIAGFGVGAAAFLAFEKLGAKVVLPQFVVYIPSAMLGVFFFLENWSRMTILAFYAVLLTCLVLLAANDRTTLLASRPLVFVGTISYSIYLLHIPIYLALSLAIGDASIRGAVKPAVLLIVLTASYLSYRWVERPSQQIILNKLRTGSLLRGGVRAAEK
ncbi:MAG TPA: acyltransferase [Pseudolabrys sp.]